MSDAGSDDENVRVVDEGGRPEDEEDQLDLPGMSRNSEGDDDERAPRMVWDSEPQTEGSAVADAAPRQTESMARRAMRKIGKRLTGKPSTRRPSQAQAQDAENRGSSLSRFFGLGGASSAPGSEGGAAPERRGSSLARMLGADEKGDLRGSSVGRLVFSESKDGKMKAFRNIRKLTSRARKTITGMSSSEAADALEESRKFQKQLARQESGQEEELVNSNIAPEDRLMAAVGARRREWQMVYSHL
jgi:hypothetical protein